MTTSESSFLTADEPESISFHDSLRFFRQQLGNDYPTSDVAAPKNAEPVNSCSISIPTVDSILESVRVLRAIQKSQTFIRGIDPLDQDTYSPLFKADSLLSSFQPTDSDAELVDKSRANFWPVETQEVTCCNSNKANLEECSNNLKYFVQFQKNGALSNQVGHTDKITENNNLFKSVSDLYEAESISNKCSEIENKENRLSSETDVGYTLTEDSRYDDTTSRDPGYSVFSLKEKSQSPADGGRSILDSSEFNKYDSHAVFQPENNSEVYRTKHQVDDALRCKLLSHVESLSEGEDADSISKEADIEESSYRKQRISDDEELKKHTTEELASGIDCNTLLNSLENNSVGSEVTEDVQSVHLKNNGLPLRTKLTTSSWDLVSIVKILFSIEELQLSKTLFEEQRKAFVLSKGVFSDHSEGHYTLLIKERALFILDEKGVCLCVLPLVNAEVSVEKDCSLVVDNKMGECLYLKYESEEELQKLNKIFQSSSECIHLVQYPLKYYQNVVIIDLGSCSTRAGILMNQPTLPTLFFPSVCAVNKVTGKHVYGVDALEPKERQNATLSFPLRPSAKILKHSVDVLQVTGIFEKIFKDLRIDPKSYTVLVCLPRSLSTNVQNAIVNVLLEDFNVKAVSLSHQAILTMYAHNVSTGIVLDIGDRMDILPVIDGFIVEGGVSRLPYGGQRLIHHMKHALAQKHISLSNDIDSFVVQYISEKLLYVAEDYEKEESLSPQTLRKAVDLSSFARDQSCHKSAELDDARFKVPEGLFNPDLWGLDSPGVHHLVQKAIQAVGVDARKKVSENIYLSGGVTLIPGFVQRLIREITKLNEPRITPKVYASNYRYHCTFIGACRFATMEEFSQVCLTKEEYLKNRQESLKKFLLCV